MEVTKIFSIIFSTFIGLVVGKYLYIPENKAWVEAQEYCRRHYTDLALINSQSNQDQILLAAEENFTYGWIGLYLVNRSTEMWKWSGAELVTYTNWLNGQPNYWNDRQRTVVMNAKGLWNDYYEKATFPFFCSQLIVKKSLSWERALEYCKTEGKNITELTWDNERLLVKGQMQREGVDLVWTGLRFIGDQWQWVSGAPLKSETPQEISLCPVQDRCGALTSQGLLKSWDCKEELYIICE